MRPLGAWPRGTQVRGYGLVTTGAAYGIQGGLCAGQAARWDTVYASVPEMAQALALAVELDGSREDGQNRLPGPRGPSVRGPGGNVFGVYHHAAH